MSTQPDQPEYAPYELRPATSLADAIGHFDPQRALSGELVNVFYVDRGEEARDDMMTLLEGDLRGRQSKPVKLVFSGHRGSGKSTELNRLCQEIHGKFFIVKVSLAEMVSPVQATYVDILLSAATALFKEAAAENIIERAPRQHFEAVLDRIRRFFRDSWSGYAPPTIPAAEHKISTEISVFIARLQTEYRTQVPTRDEVRNYAEKRLSEVLTTINDLAAEVRSITGTPVLFVFDDTDKPEPERAKDVFFNHADVLTDFNASAIYTFPIELVYTLDYVPFSHRFDGCSRLPNWKITSRKGLPYDSGIQLLRELIECRLQPDLIDQAARDTLITASGGHTRSLIQMMRFACVRARRQPSGKISMAEAEAAIANLRGDFLGTLASEQYAWLAARHRDKELSRDQRTQELLYSLALLEYKNSDWWCDVHPVVLPLVKERAGNVDL